MAEILATQARRLVEYTGSNSTEICDFLSGWWGTVTVFSEDGGLLQLQIRPGEVREVQAGEYVLMNPNNSGFDRVVPAAEFAAQWTAAA